MANSTPKRLTATKTYARIRMVNGIIFGIMGIFIIAQMIHGVGFTSRAIAGIVLGTCLVGLAVVRVRSALNMR